MNECYSHPSTLNTPTTRITGEDMLVPDRVSENCGTEVVVCILSPDIVPGNRYRERQKTRASQPTRQARALQIRHEAHLAIKGQMLRNNRKQSNQTPFRGNKQNSTRVQNYGIAEK